MYENALYLELDNLGLKCRSQCPIEVYYDSNLVGHCFADIIVEDAVILELKAAENVCEEHELQLINYLRATEMEIGLLLNFGKSPEFRRKIFTNDRTSINDP